MGARRSMWLWVGTGAFLLVVLAVWVFRASLLEQRKPLASFGANGFDVSRPDPNSFPQSTDPNAPLTNPSMDPRVQETLRTINEINRINKLNQEFREKTPKNSLPNPAPPARIKNQIPSEKDEKKP